MAIASSRSLFLGSAALLTAAVALVAACSSDATPSTPAGDAGGGTTVSTTCASPGKVTEGAADTHCGAKTQEVLAASCDVKSDAGDDQGDSCDYGATMFGTSAMDDDCKYKVSFTNDPICEGSTAFTVTVMDAVGGKPVDIADGVDVETFIPSDKSAPCSTSTHQVVTDNFKETAAGSGVYKGAIKFDLAGQWLVRFHIHEECTDVLESSPHGHAAFFITVP